MIPGFHRQPESLRLRKGSKLNVTLQDGRAFPARVLSSRWNRRAGTQMIEIEETL